MQLRSAQWYAGQDRNPYIHRAWTRRGGSDLDFLIGSSDSEVSRESH
ncbi:hypothetical protein IMZ11_18090 [Microtetraspora sp. AC03309]|nr:hypothetical protein [Microtetraspora sp. AC03309]MCC5577538.1 hypothetical protein [Microtetraspora sp. AC03309]